MTTTFTSAKIIGITGAAWLSGSIASISLISLPAITESTKQDHLPASHAIKLWRHTFNAGFALAPPTAAITAASLALCAWTAPSTIVNVGAVGGVRSSVLFLVAAALAVGIVPYTLVFMRGTNERLLELAGKKELTRGEGEEGGELLGRWRVLNLGRCLLPLAGAVVAGVVGLV